MGLCHTLIRLSMRIIFGEQDYANGIPLIEEAKSLAEDSGRFDHAGLGRRKFGIKHRTHDHDLPKAKLHYERSIAYFKQARFGASTSLVELAGVEQELGNWESAQRCYSEAFVLQKANPSVYAYILANLANIALMRKQAERAAVLLAAIPEETIPSLLNTSPAPSALSKTKPAPVNNSATRPLLRRGRKARP